MNTCGLVVCVLTVFIGLLVYILYEPFPHFCEYHGKERLDGKTVIITGANSGIGKETALELAKRGARVICACRSIERGNAAVTEIRHASGNENVVMKQLDLASLKSIRQFVKVIKKEEKRLDILINNAGIGCKSFTKKTEDGFDDVIATNYLGHFLLTNLLLNMLQESQPSRIIIVSSDSYWDAKDIDLDNLVNHAPRRFCDNYERSKLACIVFALELAKRLQNMSVTVNSLNPGTIYTPFFGKMLNEGEHSISDRLLLYITFFLYSGNPHQGAQSIVFAAVNKELQDVSGIYIGPCQITRTFSLTAKNQTLAKKLWEISASLVKLKHSRDEL